MDNYQEQTIINSENKKPGAVSRLESRGVLLVLSGDDLGRSFIIDKSPIRIGREAWCDFVIDDPQISKRHCEIRCDGDDFFINDLESTNSTYLNNKLLKKEQSLVYSDRITMGSTVVRFFREEAVRK